MRRFMLFDLDKIKDDGRICTFRQIMNKHDFLKYTEIVEVK